MLRTAEWERPHRAASIALRIVAGCTLLSACAGAGAQAPGAVKELAGFLNTGGYFLTGNGRTAIGTPKFYNGGAFYVRPKRIGPITLTGGVESVNASDHFLPFTGGNAFSLLGLSFRVAVPTGASNLTPYLSGGVFAGRVRSVAEGFDRTAFTPSLSVGVEYPIGKILRLGASYRISQHINGVNTDGFGLSLRLY